MTSTELPEVINFEPGPFDVHMHPRIFDVITYDDFVPINIHQEGKAGLRVYTETALRSGITGGLAMPNESVRLYNPFEDSLTESLWYPIANKDRLIAAESAISHEAYMPTGVIFGLDPKDMYIYDEHSQKAIIDIAKLQDRFLEVQDDVWALKIYGAETTNNQNIKIEDIPTVVTLWAEVNEGKPIIMHLEDENVGKVLQAIAELPSGKDIPLHIAHVSSQQEMEAVIEAKDAGMNVTCEVTPHHLSIDESALDLIHGYACVKPGLKKRSDVDFLWRNMDKIDIFASDCAPHRISDKESDPPAFGIVNHAIMLPLLLGAAASGNLSVDDIEKRLCINPRQRFNVSIDGYSRTIVNTQESLTATEYDQNIQVQYVANSLAKLAERGVEIPRLVGRVVFAEGGQSCVGSDFADLNTSYTHLLRPLDGQQAA